MAAIRFRLRFLLLAVPVVAVLAVVLYRWVDAMVILDATSGCNGTCEVHQVRMSTKLVNLNHGMKAISPMVEARRMLFPHADEPYDSGYCLPTQHSKARVYVCPQCTQARADWLRGGNSP